MIVREVVNLIGKKRADVLVDCPMNMPATPAVPICMIPEIGIRDRWPKTCLRLSAFGDKSCSVPISKEKRGSSE